MILKHSHTFFAFVPHWWASGNPRKDIYPQILFKVSKKKLPVSNFLLSRDQVKLKKFRWIYYDPQLNLF